MDQLCLLQLSFVNPVQSIKKHCGIVRFIISNELNVPKRKNHETI